jgi:predicted nucleic acid-binding protein
MILSWRSPPTKTTSLKSDRLSQPKYTIAEGCLQIQPFAKAQMVVRLLTQTLEKGETEAIAVMPDVD